MKTDPTQTTPCSLVKTVMRFKVLILLIALLTVPLFSASTASIPQRSTQKVVATIPERVATPETRSTDHRFLTAVGIGADLFAFMPQAGLETVAIHSSDCMTPATAFTLGDTVCVKITNAPTGFRATQVLRRLSIVGPDGFIRAKVDVPGTSDTATVSFTIPTTETSVVGGETIDNRGTWLGVSYSGSDGSAQFNAPFTVTSNTPVAQLILLSAVMGETDLSAGDNVSFSLFLTNSGPNPAANVSVTDSIPQNTTFQSQTQSDPNFQCTNPNVGDTTGTTTCTIASLPAGAQVRFTLTYNVISGTPTNTIIVNTASVTTETAQRTTAENSTSAAAVVTEAATPGTCTLTCPADKVATADTTVGGVFGAFVTYGAATVTGDCGTVTNNPVSGSFFPVGTHTVTSTASNGGSCTFLVRVLDTPAPTIECPPDQTVTAAAGADSATVSVGTPTFTASGGGTVVGVRSDSTPEDPKLLTDPYPIGITGITWTVTDADGRTASCTQRIIVNAPCTVDTESPTITAPADITVFTGPDNTGCSISLDDELGQATATDDCSATITVSGIPAGNNFPIGQTVLTYTATDPAGHTATDTQTVTVIDNTLPIIQAPADASYVCVSEVPAADPSQARGPVLDANGQFVVDGNGNLVFSGPPFDNCGVPTVTVTQTDNGGAGSASSPLVITRVFTATDASGNSASSTQTITVIDAVAPTITAPADVTAYTGPGATSCDTVVSDSTLGTASASDNCTVTVARSPSGNTFPVGVTTVIWTATDGAGNTATATQTVTVIDNTAPVVTAPPAVTLYTGPGATSCSFTVTDLDSALGTGSATDNCPGVGAVTRSGVPAGNIFPVGTTTLTYSATDAHGNTGTATQVVTVIDNTVPVFDSCPMSIVLDPSCPSGAIATYATPTATDNCGVQSVVLTAGLASGSVFPIGTTTVTHVATDIYGNTASCSFTVTVKTPAQAVQDLITATEALQPPLTGQQAQGLVSKLNQALTSINAGNFNPACGKLGDYVTQVQNYINNGTLTSAQGTPLITSANKVRNAIGCTSLACY